MVAGVDYSWARPGGAAIKQAGLAFAVRYLPYPGAGGKGLTADELADLQNNGIAVVAVFESTGNRALSGFDAGNADGQAAQDAMNALGFPADRPCYFAVDFDASAGQQDVIDSYLRGVANALGISRVGVYGSYAVVAACHDNGTARWFWQTYAWSAGQFFSGNHLFQYQNGVTLNGGDVDYDRAYPADYGQWLPGGATSDMDLHDFVKQTYQRFTGSVPGDDIIQQKVDYINGTGNVGQVIQDILDAGDSYLSQHKALAIYQQARIDTTGDGSYSADAFATDRLNGGDTWEKVASIDIPFYVKRSLQLDKLLEHDVPAPISAQDQADLKLGQQVRQLVVKGNS